MGGPHSAGAWKMDSAGLGDWLGRRVRKRKGWMEGLSTEMGGREGGGGLERKNHETVLATLGLRCLRDT